MQRWTLATLDQSHSYTFPINPNAQTSPLAQVAVDWSWNIGGSYAGIRQLAKPVDWSFSGVLRDQQQYDDMLTWLTTYRQKLLLITDLPETMIIRITAFAPARTSPQRRNVPWRHTYTVKATVFSYAPGITVAVTGPLAAITMSAPSGSAGNAAVVGPVSLITTAAYSGTVSTP